MTWEPITAAELLALLHVQLAHLDDETRPVWDRFRIEPTPIPCSRPGVDDATPDVESVFCLARDGDEVLVYDDVEDAFGTGRVGSDGVLRTWRTYGEELRWAVQGFAREREARSRPAG